MPEEVSYVYQVGSYSNRPIIDRYVLVRETQKCFIVRPRWSPQGEETLLKVTANTAVVPSLEEARELAHEQVQRRLALLRKDIAELEDALANGVRVNELDPVDPTKSGEVEL